MSDKENNTKNKMLILGVGNTLRHDDGIGPVIIELLKEQQKVGIDYLDGGIDGLALLDEIKQYNKAIIIDAVNMRAEPGEIKVFTSQEAKINITSDALSTHGFGLAEVIGLMEQLEIKTELKIIGIQPADLSFGEGLSAIISSKLSIILKEVNRLL